MRSIICLPCFFLFCWCCLSVWIVGRYSIKLVWSTFTVNNWKGVIHSFSINVFISYFVFICELWCVHCTSVQCYTYNYIHPTCLYVHRHVYVVWEQIYVGRLLYSMKKTYCIKLWKKEKIGETYLFKIGLQQKQPFLFTLLHNTI